MATTPRRWRITQLTFGIVYLLGALGHFYLGWRMPEIYESFADQALFEAYTSVWVMVIVPNLTILQPLVTLFEVGLAAALLWRGRAVRIGHAAGALFQVALILSGPWGLLNAVLAGIHTAALRYSYPNTTLALLAENKNEHGTRWPILSFSTVIVAI